MAIHAVNLKEVEELQETIKKIQSTIREDASYREDIENQRGQYTSIKKYLEYQVRFLMYSHEIPEAPFYRIRKINNSLDHYNTVSDLIYPKAEIVKSERMNNASFRVLYTSLNELTAMSEARINTASIGQKFQLTQFKSEQPIRSYSLGDFSRAHLNLPRKSSLYKDFCLKYLGDIHTDHVVQGYAALECVLYKVLYNTDDLSYLLSSLLADAIFTAHESIEAITYPTQQSSFGVNIAFRQNAAEKLKIEHSYVNELTGIYSNGFYTYKTLKSCSDFSNPQDLLFEDSKPNSGYY
ncbi:RES domain-containing protein [Pseudomonas anguilliseptica]|uniref:RES domain-containing protein n=1 Tax=Pseudomonas anguilliseptica TaxID=53406 RepID=UPI0022AF099C|nr:RES domain-containing protein [Pseudomonas anguilliseptica]MCZ4323167.1 RES domain-containing protein [Pseudomonas anguilliseptica]